MNAYLRLMVSFRLYTTIIWQKRFGNFLIPISLFGRVFATAPVKSYQRLTKWYLIPPC